MAQQIDDLVNSLLSITPGNLGEKEINKIPEAIRALQILQRMPGQGTKRGKQIEALQQKLTADKAAKYEVQVQKFETELAAFRGEFKTQRAQAALTLEQQLTQQADIEYQTLFKPEIRKMLAAKGILEGGAFAEVEAKYKSRLQAPIAQRVAEYKAGTTEADLALGLSGIQTRLGMEREQGIQTFNEALGGLKSEFMAEISRVSRPSTLFNYAQFLPLALYGFQGTKQQAEAGMGNTLEPDKDFLGIGTG